ncbi:MAG: GDP-mannose 4,6-dehydratase [Rhodospirillales bacterium]|nr:GDP-mannose 4,6-dehydratase [Rhodospirillales bacterium]
MAKRALLFGISGQDGGYLAQSLLSRGYEVHGASRDKDTTSFHGLHRLGVADKVHLHSASINDFRSVLQVIKAAAPGEIYHLAGQSSVATSFEQPIETFESIATSTINILESIRFLDPSIRFYGACSSECFGDTPPEGANESTAFKPRSPYGVAKAAAFWTTASYRRAYSLFACSGILFNHDSDLRPERFATRKIVKGVVDIHLKKSDRLTLGDVDVHRDWGWAGEYVEAMIAMLNRDTPEDFVVATGKAYSLRDFVKEAFAAVGLDWQNHVAFDPALRRPFDIGYSRGDPARAAEKLGWRASMDMRDVVRRLMDSEIAARKERT